VIATRNWLYFNAVGHHGGEVYPPVGPSLQLVLLLEELAFELTAEGIAQAWRWWSGASRANRRLMQLEQRGLVTTESAGTRRVVRLTESGRIEALGGRDPLQQWSRNWDGRWRVVLFDVPEHQEALRARLRRALRALSFGYLQNSVWISPDSVHRLRARLAGLAVDAETLTFLEAHACGGESNDDLVRGAWDFPRINRGYEDHCNRLLRQPAQSPQSPGGRAAWTRWLVDEWRAWHRVLRHDPLLPDALLPASYRGKEAWALRMKVLRDLPVCSSGLASG
jgi:phenylacetic acid degradation operon negative regulatory protein